MGEIRFVGTDETSGYPRSNLLSMLSYGEMLEQKNFWKIVKDFGRKNGIYNKFNGYVSLISIS